jgi:hypothetical protein
MSYLPNDAHRAFVNTMAGYGINAEQIAAVLVSQGHPVTVEILREHYGQELNTAVTVANAKVLQTIYKAATGKSKDAPRAAMYWMDHHGQQKSVEERIKEALQLSERLMARHYE